MKFQILKLCPFLIVTWQLVFISTSKASEENLEIFAPAIRSAVISEREFEARALAMGLTPIGQLIARRKLEDQSKQNQFREKLELAQLEWLKVATVTPGTSKEAVTSAIDSLLNLELQHDWNDEAHVAFFEFLLRKATLLNRQSGTASSDILFRIARHIKQRTITSMDPMMKNSSVLNDAENFAEKLQPMHFSFSDVPEDIIGVFINGFWVPRTIEGFPYYVVPNSSPNVDHQNQRITAVSNLYRPKTFFFSQSAENLDYGGRQLWANDPHDQCAIDITPYGNNRQKNQVLGPDECERTIGLLATKGTIGGTRRINDFGSGRITNDPFQSVPPIEPLPKVQPWIWAAIGGVALTALIVSAQSKPTNAQPTTSNGW